MDIKNKLITKAFLDATDEKTKTEILAAIAKHYGITESEALEEVTGEESEHLLDYLTGNIRKATSLLMKRHNLAAIIAEATRTAKQNKTTIEIYLDPISNAEEDGDYGYCPTGTAGKLLYRFGKQTHTITPDGTLTEV